VTAYQRKILAFVAQQERQETTDTIAIALHGCAYGRLDEHNVGRSLLALCRLGYVDEERWMITEAGREALAAADGALAG
jgi:hypothetical protein